ncbi:MAG: hypothetical protein ABJB05_08350 [Parafilimonas sp.]
MIKSYHTDFFTATILRRQKLLHDNHLKQIVVDSLEWLVTEKRCSTYAFVIMFATLPEDYKWSSAMFYEKNIMEPL